ncbi:biofilm PGA synthesis protein PgaB [Marinifilum breve]|uniref:Biofilm PGA synthesis protein PgaB n=1 Tax=Marinifilum breve TaxID=2184082 RepID=A0A2V4AD47_9BACT|nr:BPL-N domain-containing protein [Marinifilum breve]PXY01934.1 biofilm PGA synthesis protein PgaB [Marinifilum breve]
MNKFLTIGVLLFTLICVNYSCKRVETKAEQRIKVGVFDKNGDSPWCIADAVEALKIDPKIDCEVIRASQIVSDEIFDFDAIVFPGGSGRSETMSLGESGIERVVSLVKDKGIAVVGICAGAYIMTNTPNYPSLNLTGYKAIDIEHDHRGHGLAKFSLTEEGEKIFPELKDREISFCQYYEGPVLVSAEDEIEEGSLGTMLSDVHTVEGTPANMTNNRPFIVANTVGKGKVASFVGHPECTPGMRWMLPRIVRWATNNEMVKYPKSVMRPDFFKNEIIYTKDIQDLQSKYYKNLSGSKEEKLEAIDKVIELACWSSKKWIPGLLRDKDADVRSKASIALVKLERTDALADLEVAFANETNDDCKVQLEKSLTELKNILGKNRN